MKDNNGNSVADSSGISKVNGVFDLTEADVLDMINSEMKDVTSENGIEQLISDMKEKDKESCNIVAHEKNLNKFDDTNGNHIPSGNHFVNSETMKGYGKRKVFDMFQQVEDDDVDLLSHGNDEANTDGKNDLKHEVDVLDRNSGEDEVTRKTLEKIEKLYSLSVYDQTHIPAHFEIEMTGDENLYENGNYLDQEMKLLDSYDINGEEVEFLETHVCRNCGHSVTLETTGKFEHAEIVEHDFCCKCSPLKFTSEMLERRRIQRLTENDNSCN
jgi:hypothetical protein